MSRAQSGEDKKKGAHVTAFKLTRLFWFEEIQRECETER